MNFKTIVIYVVLFLFSCKNPFLSNEQNHYEKIAFLYDEIKINSDKIKKNISLPKKMGKKNITSKNLKQNISELIKFLNKHPNFLDSESLYQFNVYNLLNTLYQKLNDNIGDPKLKKLAPQLKLAIKNSSKKLKLLLENRLKFEDLILKIKYSDHKILELLKKLLKEIPNLCILQREIDGNTLLHELLISKDLIKIDLSKNQKSISPNSAIVEKCIEILIEYIFKNKKYWNAFTLFNKKNLSILNFAARKNYIKRIFNIFDKLPKSKDHDIDKIVGLNLNYNNKENPLHSAFSSISKQSAIVLLNKAPKLLISTDANNQTPLHVIDINFYTESIFPSFIFNKENIVTYEKELIKALNSLDNFSNTPLFYLIDKLKRQYSSKTEHPVLNFFLFLKNDKNKYITDAKSFVNKNIIIKRSKILESITKKLKDSKEDIIKSNGVEIYENMLKIIKELK